MKSVLVLFFTLIFSLSVDSNLSYANTSVDQVLVQRAQGGEITAQFELAKQYAKLGNLEQAYHWYRKAAQQGNADALFLQAVAEIKGQGTEVDQLKGLKHLKQAAEQGQRVAQFTLGYLYKKGALGEANIQAANRWFKEAADQSLAVAQVALGTHYAKGLGFERDREQAEYWFRKAYALDSQLAGYNLASLYLKAANPVSEQKQGLKILQRTAENGHILSQIGLSNFYRKGAFGLKKDAGKAIYWLKKAADKNSSLAQLSLGAIYLKGELVPANGKQARHWLTLAAKKGSPIAQMSLGAALVKGNVIPRNLSEAYTWFSVAATSGNKKARQIRDKLATKLTPSQLSEAQNRATEWHEHQKNKESGRSESEPLMLPSLSDEEGLMI